MNDYVLDNQKLESFFEYKPEIEGFRKAIEQRKFESEKRQVLVDTLYRQYENVEGSKKQLEFINQLKNNNTYTVTTGHQICLFTGPLYFVYKILSVVKLADRLKSEFYEKDFVPIYWMATEDHDFEEINHFFLHNKKFSFQSSTKGAVGDIKPEVSEMLSELEQELGQGKLGVELFGLFQNAYTSNNLSEATFKLVHSLLGEYGIVVLDPNNPELKKLFIPAMAEELNQQIGFSSVTETSKKLTDLGYKTQVNPRDINLFYLQEGDRLRIEKHGDSFRTVENKVSWSKNEVLEELNQHPERFSPNVILRPLYQEVILPNLSYTGGAGELSYWFQLKEMFAAFQVPLPILMLRNSMIVVSKNNVTRLEKLGIKVRDLFSEITDLEERLLKMHGNHQTEFVDERKKLKELFQEIQQVSGKVTPALSTSVEATEAKVNKLIEKLEKKLLKHEKINQKTLLDQLYLILDEVFPNGGFQERQFNFSEYYLEYGKQYLDQAIDMFDPIKPEVSVLKLKN